MQTQVSNQDRFSKVCDVIVSGEMSVILNQDHTVGKTGCLNNGQDIRLVLLNHLSCARIRLVVRGVGREPR